VTCDRFDGLWVSDDPADWGTLFRHARECSACAARVRWERRLDRAARATRPELPDGLVETILRRRAEETGTTATRRTHRIDVERFRNGVGRIAGPAVAASLLIALGFLVLPERHVVRTDPGLLSSSGLVAALDVERRLDAEVAARTERLGPATHSWGADALNPAVEEIAFLDEAIAECRRALLENALHAELRRNLRELTTRKLALLRIVGGAGATGDPSPDSRRPG